MANALQVIDAAKAEVEERQSRRGKFIDDRMEGALESIADDLTMIRAEMTVNREGRSKGIAKEATGKTFYERTTEALRLIGTGNAAGLIATGAALGNAIEKHVGNVSMLKWSAILFALGVMTFSYAYYSNYQAYRAIDTIDRQREQLESEGRPIPERKGSSASQFAWRSSIATTCSFVLFHLGMVLSLLTLLFA